MNYREQWEVVIGYRGRLVTVRVFGPLHTIADAARTKVSREKDWPFSKLVMLHGRQVVEGGMN